MQTSTIDSWLMMKLHLIQHDIFFHKYDVIDSQSASLTSSLSKSILVCLLLVDWKELSCLMLHTLSFWNVVMTLQEYFHWMFWQRSILSFFKLVIYSFEFLSELLLQEWHVCLHWRLFSQNRCHLSLLWSRCHHESLCVQLRCALMMIMSWSYSCDNVFSVMSLSILINSSSLRSMYSHVAFKTKVV